MLTVPIAARRSRIALDTSVHESAAQPVSPLLGVLPTKRNPPIAVVKYPKVAGNLPATFVSH